MVLSDPGIAADVAANVEGASLTYSGALAILEDAAAGGMTASKLSSLQAFAAELNVAGGVSASPYVQQIADDVVFENSANSTWNGGAATAAPLGDLGATSTQAQVDELIGEWFLGTNLPSLGLSAVGGTNYGASYQNSTLPLYGPTGAPVLEDVNQGNLGDCYLLASLGEVALRDPGAIETMIARNGNGTYGVRFFVDGQPDYVTVNSELPVMDGEQWANGSTLEFANGATDDWAALIEKAYAQLNAQTNAPHGMTLGSASDSFAGITAGDGSALTLITDQPETPTSLGPWNSASFLASLMSRLAASWNAGQEILMSTPANSSGNLVGDHMFMVVAINAPACALTLENPWDSAYGGPLAMNFTETIQQLAADECTLWVTAGSPPGSPAPATIASNGATTLAQVGVIFELNSAGGGAGPSIKVNGGAVIAGQFAAGWTPVGAAQTATGYEVAWSVPGANEYVVWDTDSDGDFTSAATAILGGASAELEAVEASFGESFPGAGVKATPMTIATNGGTILAEVGNLFELNPAGGGTGPLLQINGGMVTAGEFAAGWTPVGATRTASGYEVAWSVPGRNEFVVWNVNGAGAYASPGSGILSGASDALQQVELNFGETFRGAEAPTPSAIATNGVTTLARVANEFELNPAGGGAGPFLEIGGSPVMAGQFPLGWTPVGAVQTASGYLVAWDVPGQNEYVVWDANSAGAYASAATGIVSGASAELEGLEANFGETFPGAGAEATPTTIAANGAITLAEVGNLFELNPAGGGTGPLLQLKGGVVAAGEFPLGWTPIGAEKTSTGYEVGWSVPGQNEFTVWNVDSSGHFIGDSMGIVSGESPALEGLLPGVGEAVNDGGRLSPLAGSLEAYDAIAGGALATAFADLADPAHGGTPAGGASSLTPADWWAAHAGSGVLHGLTA